MGLFEDLQNKVKEAVFPTPGMDVQNFTDSLYKLSPGAISQNSQITTAVDSMFFNFPVLDVADSFRTFNYQFVI